MTEKWGLVEPPWLLQASAANCSLLWVTGTAAACLVLKTGQCPVQGMPSLKRIRTAGPSFNLTDRSPLFRHISSEWSPNAADALMLSMFNREIAAGMQQSISLGLGPDAGLEFGLPSESGGQLVPAGAAMHFCLRLASSWPLPGLFSCGVIVARCDSLCDRVQAHVLSLILLRRQE